MKKPSISELLDLLNKPALLYWANKIGLEGVRLSDYYKKSKGAGLSIHAQIKRFVEDGMPFENATHQENYLRFIADKAVIDLEQAIETTHFTGRYDVRIKMQDSVYICDFKSSSGLYFENKLQLAAYRMAFPECKVAVVEVPSFTLKPVEIEDFTELEGMIKCLAYIYKHKGKYV